VPCNPRGRQNDRRAQAGSVKNAKAGGIVMGIYKGDVIHQAAVSCSELHQVDGKLEAGKIPPPRAALGTKQLFLMSRLPSV
jgi:hypothetical protein